MKAPDVIGFKKYVTNEGGLVYRTSDAEYEYYNELDGLFVGEDVQESDPETLKYVRLDLIDELTEACRPYLKRKKMTPRPDCERLNKAYKKMRAL